jgi:hypothetical protein
MLVRIDVDEDKIIEQGEGYMILDIPKRNRYEYACKIRTATGVDPKVFPEGNIKKVKAIYIGLAGGISIHNR